MVDTQLFYDGSFRRIMIRPLLVIKRNVNGSIRNLLICSNSGSFIFWFDCTDLACFFHFR